MNENEKMLVEAVSNYLNDKTRLGLEHDDDATDDNNLKKRGQAYLHGHIDQLFALKAAELKHHTGACAAFAKVHGYKDLDDQTFAEAMNKEMVAQGIPAAERHEAIDLIDEIIKEVSDGQEHWAERDFGLVDMDDMLAVSQPEQYEDDK